MSPLRFGLILVIGVIAGSFGTKYRLVKEFNAMSPLHNTSVEMAQLNSQRQLVDSCMSNGVYFVHVPAQRSGVIISCEFMQTKAIGPKEYDSVMQELRELHTQNQNLNKNKGKVQ